jgi:hypothetical protein
MSGEAPDLTTAWAEACAEFEKATGYNLASGPGGKTGNDIVNKFNAAKIKDAEDRQKIDKVKTVIGKTVVAVERLGHIAAQGASMVFGSPANITMNCISFFIDAGMAYGDIARNIDDLFSRIVTILERFQIYRDYEQIMKKPMIDVAHRLLIAVVNICGRCYKKLKENKLKKLARLALFSDDGGIKEQFAVLDSLEKQELQMKGTLTLVVTETTQRAVASGFQNMDAKTTKLARDVTELNESSTDRKILKDLKDKLGINVDSLSKGEYQSHQNKLESGSCSWLKTDPQYQSWTSTANESGSLLVLQGDEGCGKSYTLTSIIRDLSTRYPQNQGNASRISVAYCYLTRAGKKDKDAQSSKNGASVRDALREWAWQIINNDVFYRKNVQAAFKQSSDLGDLKEMWAKLFLSHLDDDVIFYLLLDGAHELDDKGLQDLITIIQTLSTSEGRPNRLKILISSRPTFVQKLTAKYPLQEPVVDLPAKNNTDMDKFIRGKANELRIFQKSSTEVQELKEKVCSGLLDAVNGNFLLADIKLQEISTKYDPEEVKRIVESVKEGGALENSVIDIIRGCNRTLNSREMEDLNTLLLWVIFGEWQFSIAELEDVLKQRRSSLQPLAHEIKEKFSAFFKLPNTTTSPEAGVSLKYDSIADYFKNLSKEHETSDTVDSKALTKGEIHMVQHFIKKLCDEDIYSKLGLGDFFDQKLSQSDTSVTVDCENAHAKMSLTCLRVLTSDVADEGKDLKWYAGNYMVTHLKKLDLDTTDPRVKAELGPPLVKMFRDSSAIKRTNNVLSTPWSFDDEGVRNVVRLLRSSALTSKINTAESDNKDWVESILKDPHPEIALLKDSANSMAERWASSEKATSEYDTDVFDSFQWLYGYMNKVGAAVLACRSVLTLPDCKCRKCG